MASSRDLRQLRILSGTHAGASLDLSEGIHSLGDHHDCDISITDWRFQTLLLHVGGDRSVLARWVGDAPQALPLEEYRPIDFDGVLVCFGSCDADWPERTALLARSRTVGAALAASRPDSLHCKSHDRGQLLAPGVAAMAMIGIAFGGWLWMAASKPRPAPVMTLTAAHAALQRALDANVGRRLAVSETAGGLLVDGLADDQAQAHAAMRAIEAVPSSYAVAARFTVASDLVETIRSAIGIPAAAIDYRGDGVFDIAVRVTDAEGARAAIARVAADLSPTVRRLDAEIEEIPKPPAMPAMASAWDDADGTQVMETRDGVKHLLLPAATVADDVYPTPPSSPLTLASLHRTNP